MLQVAGSWSNLLATMLVVLVAIDLALGLTLAIVITRSTAEEVRKLWKH